MPMCQAFGCSNKTSEERNKKFFAIPNPVRDPARCRAWLHAIGTDKHSFASYKFSKHRVVCEDHFEQHCFMRDFQAELGFRQPKEILKHDAVPTIFVHRQQATTSRESSMRRAASSKTSEMLSNLLNPPEDASAEASEGETSFHFVDSSSIPPVNEIVEITKQHITKASGKAAEGPLSSKRKRRRRLSNRASSSSKEVATQTDWDNLMTASTQTEAPEYYDGEVQEPPVQTDAPPDHSYCTTEAENYDKTVVEEDCGAPSSSQDVIEEEEATTVNESTVKLAEPVEKRSSSSHEDSHPSDVSYHPESDDWSEDNEEREATMEEKCVKGKKYIVYEESLDLLFYSLRCNQCFAKVQDVEKVNLGTLHRAKVHCVNGHQMLIWDSQPMLGSTPAGNLLVSAAILFSGNTFHKLGQFAEFLGLSFIGKTTYFNFQREILNPIINYEYIKRQEILLNDCQEKNAMLSGDGRCDSPGYNAKYCTYSMMDTETEKIVVSELVQVTETTSSVAMEKLGFQRCMDKLKESNVTVDMVATDRHCGIRALMKKDYPHIDHQFDVWHLSKTIKKKLLAKSKTKSCEELACWIQAISNHLWWSAHTCDRDPELLVEKFSSVVYHTANIHTWDTCNKFHRCEHPPIPEDDEIEPAWLELDSPVHNALKDIVMDKRLLKDIRFLNRSCHTGSLEVFHGAMLKYCPKRQEFDYPGMLARTQLAIIDHNENVGRQQAVVRTGPQKGQKRYNVVFSKASKKWVVKPVYEAKGYTFVSDLLMDAVAMKTGQLNITPQERRDLPQNIARIPKPNKADLVSNFKSRFGKS